MKPPEFEEWLGTFRDPVWYGRVCCRLAIRFEDGLVLGQGRDPIGRFAVRGTRDPRTGIVEFTATYDCGRTASWLGQLSDDRFTGAYEAFPDGRTRGNGGLFDLRPATQLSQAQRQKLRRRAARQRFLWVRNVGLFKIHLSLLIAPVAALRDVGMLRLWQTRLSVGAIFAGVTLAVGAQLWLSFGARRLLQTLRARS